MRVFLGSWNVRELRRGPAHTHSAYTEHTLHNNSHTCFKRLMHAFPVHNRRPIQGITWSQLSALPVNYMLCCMKTSKYSQKNHDHELCDQTFLKIKDLHANKN